MLFTLVNPEERLASARLNLALARLYKQKAEMLVCWANSTADVDNCMNDTLLFRYVTIAKLCRRQAKLDLQRVEEHAGYRYNVGLDVELSAKDLGGRSFCKWPEYQSVFNGQPEIWGALNVG